MKKICFISGVISRSGGTERVGSIIANSLSDLGYDVTILSFWNSGEPYFGLDKTIIYIRFGNCTSIYAKMNLI